MYKLYKSVHLYTSGKQKLKKYTKNYQLVRAVSVKLPSRSGYFNRLLVIVYLTSENFVKTPETSKKISKGCMNERKLSD